MHYSLYFTQMNAGDGILIPVLNEFVPFARERGVDIQIYNKSYRTYRGQVVLLKSFLEIHLQMKLLLDKSIHEHY
jgi:hypothetical protein